MVGLSLNSSYSSSSSVWFCGSLPKIIKLVINYWASQLKRFHVMLNMSLVALFVKLFYKHVSSTCSRHSPVRYAKFEPIRYFIDIDILQNCLIDIDIDIDIFGIALSISISIFFRIALSISIGQYRYRYRYFQHLHIDIDIDIDIFQKCRYIDNRYVISIYRTGLPRSGLSSQRQRTT